jgi:hypothetical protein
MAGLQAGMLAGVFSAAWLVIESARAGRHAWSALNLVSTAILGHAGYTLFFGLPTIAGLSLHLVVAGIHGLIFAAILSPRTRPLVDTNAGLLFSFSCYFFTFGWLIPRLAPIMWRNASRLEWAGVHLLVGMMLGLYPDFARRLLRHPLPEPVEPSPPELPVAGASEIAAADPVAEASQLAEAPPTASHLPASHMEDAANGEPA